MRKQITFLSIVLLAICAVVGFSSYKPQGHSNPYLMMKVTEGYLFTGGSKIFIVDEVGTLEEIKLDKLGTANTGGNMSAINYEINKLNERGYDLRSSSMTTNPNGTMVQVYLFQKR